MTSGKPKCVRCRNVIDTRRTRAYSWANNCNVAVELLHLVGNDFGSATRKRQNKSNTGNANANAKHGKDAASAGAAERIDSILNMVDQEESHVRN